MSWNSISKDLRSTAVRDRLAGLATLLVICPDCMPYSFCQQWPMIECMQEENGTSLSLAEFSDFVDLSASLLTDSNFKAWL